MANESSQNKDQREGAATNRPRTNNDLEALKLILDANPELKKKVIRFMQKNYSKIVNRKT